MHVSGVQGLPSFAPSMAEIVSNACWELDWQQVPEDRLSSCSSRDSAQCVSQLIQVVDGNTCAYLSATNNTSAIHDECTYPGTPPPPPLPFAFPASVACPEASGFHKQFAIPHVDVKNWWRCKLPLQMVFKYEDKWQECDERVGKLHNKKCVTTLKLHMHKDGTTNSGVQWHRGGWHGAWQWVLPQQCLQIRFHHTASDNKAFVHSFERQAPAGFSPTGIDNNVFRYSRGWSSTSKYINWTTTIELCETWLVEDAGWSLVSSSRQCHPLFSFGSREHYMQLTDIS